MNDWSDLRDDLLPATLQDFVRLIGLAATMILVEHFGGTRLYIPVKPSPDHHLAKLIGMDNLVKLSRVYGAQDHFDIPKAERALRHLRDQKIRADIGPKSARVLALEHGLTERQIWSIVGRPANRATSQNELFG